MPGYDDYVDEGGGLLLAYPGTTTDTFFMDGKFGPQLTIDVLLDHPEDHPKIADGIIHNWFNLPNGWRVTKNGAVVEAVGWTAKNGNVQEPPSKFRNDSSIGQLLKQIKNIDPDGALLANGTPYAAALGKGIGHARWGAGNIPKRAEVAGSWTDVPGGKNISMPVELLGQASGNGQVSADFDLSSLGTDQATLDQLHTAANKASNYGEFVTGLIPTMAGTPVFAKIGDSTEGPKIYAALKAF